ncbi:MAG: sigma-70 family RNA polymerase sigma factor [Verrucomicrobiales bacterium]
MNATEQIFQENRRFLEKLAHTLAADGCGAQDLVQETYLRWLKLDPSTILKPRAMLATILSRLALNDRTSARSRREVLVAPAFILDHQANSSLDHKDLSDALMRAFEVVLQQLNPKERSVFLLREVFEWDYGEIASIINESEANCRQLLRRAKERVVRRETRYRPERGREEALLESFMDACQNGDLNQLLNCLAQDTIMISEPSDIGMPQPPTLRNRDLIAQAIEALIRKFAGGDRELLILGPNDEALLLRNAQTLCAAILIQKKDGRVRLIQQVNCPKRLQMFSRLLSSESFN